MSEYHSFFFVRTACGILVPCPAIEPLPSAVKAQSPNHGTSTTGEFPHHVILSCKSLCLYFFFSFALEWCFFYCFARANGTSERKNRSFGPLHPLRAGSNVIPGELFSLYLLKGQMKSLWRPRIISVSNDLYKIRVVKQFPGSSFRCLKPVGFSFLPEEEGGWKGGRSETCLRWLNSDCL